MQKRIAKTIWLLSMVIQVKGVSLLCVFAIKPVVCKKDACPIKFEATVLAK